MNFLLLIGILVISFFLAGCFNETSSLDTTTGNAIQSPSQQPTSSERCTPCTDEVKDDPDGVCKTIGGQSYLIYCKLVSFI